MIQKQHKKYYRFLYVASLEEVEISIKYKNIMLLCNWQHILLNEYFGCWIYKQTPASHNLVIFAQAIKISQPSPTCKKGKRKNKITVYQC